jgi:hypothetical protein
MISCIDEDEEVISTQDLLFGTWKTIEMKVNGQLETLTPCELKGTMEFTANNVIFTDYFYDDDTSSCVFEEEYSFPYTFVEDNKFKLYRSADLIIDTEIIELNTTTLVLKSFVNGGTVEKQGTYKRIN